MLEQVYNSLQFIKPELILVGTLLVSIIVDLIFKNKKVVVAFVILGLVLSFYYLTFLNSINQLIFFNMYAIDPFAYFFKIFLLVATIGIVLFSVLSKEISDLKSREGEFYYFLVALTIGMFLMTSSTNLIMMYLAIELTSLTSYMLAGFMKEEKSSSEASLKYVLYGAFSSGMMLYGISIIYGLTGSFDLLAINMAIADGVSSLALLISTVLMFVGFGYKISAVPFHFWTPDVYEGSPISVTTILSVASKAAGFSMLMRTAKIMFIDPYAAPTVNDWQIIDSVPIVEILTILSVLTMTLGNLVAIWQSNLKRLLAYSSIAHAGYLLLGVLTMNNEGYSATLIYFVTYLFMNVGAFLIVMLVSNKLNSSDIDSYKGLGMKSPFIGVMFALFLISLTGLPPTAGFVGKLYIFAALVNKKLILLAVIGVLNSVVSLYYYVRIFRNMFLRESDIETPEIKLSLAEKLLILVFAIPTIGLGLYFAPLVEFAHASVEIFSGN
ncbi:MAG: NADH-quinone oxidoreductase subunit N [Bacteroidetes bacterium]|nr:NADH-quinone oxidoreductase subunit N [Bacteroidota bacterium]